MRAVFAVAVVLMAMLCLEVEHVHGDVCATKANGCSIPYRLPFFYKRLFTPSCNRHDICYGCGAKHRFSRWSCDVAFLRDMKSACVSHEHTRRRKRHADKKDICALWAELYFVAVRAFGYWRYDRSPDTYCDESWVKSCLP